VKQSGEIVIYQSRSGSPDISIRLENDTLWLDQYQIAELFQTNRTSIAKHIKNIYTTGELTEKATCAFFAQVQSEGKYVNKNNDNRFISDYPIVKSHALPTPHLTYLVIKIKFTRNHKLLNIMSNFTQYNE